MHNYAGNPDNFPVTNQEPDDADIASPNAAVFNVMNEGLSDRTASLAGGYRTELASMTALKAVVTTLLPDGAIRSVLGLGRYRLDLSIGATDAEDLPLVAQPSTPFNPGRWFALDDAAAHAYKRTFLTSGTWTCPRNLILADLEVWGGGGGGGAGANSTASTDDAPGGSGGGAGQRTVVTSTTTPTTAYTVTIDPGGAGGVASSGVDGGASSVGSLAIANGGQAGGVSVANGGLLVIPGGVHGGGAGEAFSPFVSTSLRQWPVNIGDGGYAKNGTLPGATGGWGTLGGAGGAPGTNGTTSTQKGGSGGGGGGGGPGASAGVGAGGNGGNGNPSGAGANGSNGTAAAANSASGGGGGGGAGAGSSGSSTGGNGGAGGSGLAIVRGRKIALVYA